MKWAYKYEDGIHECRSERHSDGSVKCVKARGPMTAWVRDAMINMMRRTQLNLDIDQEPVVDWHPLSEWPEAYKQLVND